MSLRAVLLAAVVLVPGGAGALRAQDPAPPASAPPAAPSTPPAARMQWYATWAQAKAEAARLQRPILLQSAAPQCHGISGIW